MTDPLSAARGIRGILKDARMETEAGRCLPPQVIACLIETGLCRLAVPADLGGYEADPLVSLRVYEELAAAEASVAWIAWNNQLNCLTSRHLADAPRAELFGDAHVLFANSTRPSGRGVAVEGGLRVSGRWSLVSGCQLADWIPVMCVITDGSEARQLAPGVPEMRMAYLPKGSYRIVDTWHAGGLRGTGSHDVVADEVFVPAERTFAFTDANRIDRPLFRMPFRATMAAGCAAICLGIAQAALDTLLQLASTKLQVDLGPGLRDRPATQASVAEAAAGLDAARLVVHAALGELWDSCTLGKPLEDLQQARALGAAMHAARTAKDVVTTMYELAGTSALYVDCPIERAHRDVQAVAQHGILAPWQLEDAGRAWFGLPPNVPFL
jgi:alkylation response protein AidB-like acyl-CoA dehydrogenase